MTALDTPSSAERSGGTTGATTEGLVPRKPRRSTWPVLAARVLILSPVMAWSMLVVTYAGGTGGSTSEMRAALALIWVAGLIVSLRVVSWMRAATHATLLVTPIVLFFFLLSPSNAREWWEPASRVAHAEVDGDLVTIYNIRNFRYDEEGTWSADWYDATFDLRELSETWFVLTEFGGIEGIAHVMVSFEFADDRFLVISVEIRREDGESYDPIGGAFRQYEIMYVAADERDAIALRTHVHRDDTWVIPMNAGQAANQAFFLDMVSTMSELHATPRWYNTLTRSCATQLAHHYEQVNDVRFGFDRRILMPGFSDALLEELGLLPPGMNLAEIRDAYWVNERALMAGVGESFSRDIRARPEAPLGAE